MSLLADATVTLVLSDYVGVDGGGKVNILGAGISLMGQQPNGLSPGMCLAVFIDLPSKYHGQQFALSVELRDETNDRAVMVPMPPAGAPGALRIQQMVLVQRPTIPNLYLPETLPGRVQMQLAFLDGVPVQPGTLYSWQVQIDGQGKQSWRSWFYVPAPPAPPVIGGPSSPTDVTLPPVAPGEDG